MSQEEEDYLSLFVNELGEQLEELRKAILLFEEKSSQNNPYEVFFRVTHTLKGNAGFMGYEKLAETARIVCEVYRNLDPSEAMTIENINEFSKRFYVFLSAFKYLIEKKQNTDSLVAENIIKEANKILDQRNNKIMKND